LDKVKMQYITFYDLQVKCSRMVVELMGSQTWTLQAALVQASAAAGMSTCRSSCHRSLGPVRADLYQDISHTAIMNHSKCGVEARARIEIAPANDQFKVIPQNCNVHPYCARCSL